MAGVRAPILIAGIVYLLRLNAAGVAGVAIAGVAAAQRVQYRTGVHVVIMAWHLLPGVAIAGGYCCM